MPTIVTSPSTIAFTPSRIAIWRAVARSTRDDTGRCMRSSAAPISAGESSVNTRESPSPARTASPTTRPSAESPLLTLKSVMMMRSRPVSAPVAISDPNGPMPNARMPMNAAIITMNAPSAYIPPRAVRYQLIFGAALSAIVAIVPCAAVPGLPPGVNVGVAMAARRATRCTYPVQRITGSPSAITISEPGNTQSGSPMPTIAAFARIATATNAAA